MQKSAANRNLALTGGSSHQYGYSVLPGPNSHSALYQEIIQIALEHVNRRDGIDQLGDRLVGEARSAYMLRRFDLVEQISRAMISLPLRRQHHDVALYFHSFYLRESGQVEAARRLLQSLVENATEEYRGEVTMSLAGLLFRRVGDLSAALPLYVAANRAALTGRRTDWLTVMGSQRMVAAIKGLDGDHSGALADLERLMPLARVVRASHPAAFFDYLNSLSVECAESGQLERASHLCKIVLASPYANAYPEWRETGREIALKRYRPSRSLVSVNHQALTADNVVRLPFNRHGDTRLAAVPSETPVQAPARILDYMGFIMKMAMKTNLAEAERQAPANAQNERELFFSLMELLSQRQFDADQLRTLLEFADRISQPTDAEAPKE